MTAIVTTPFRVVNAQNFKEDVASSTNSVYVAIGKADAWSTTTSDITDTTPFTPSDRIDDISEAYQNMIGMKKITSADISHIVPRHTWTSGTTYIAWDSDDATIYDKAFYVITSEFKIYKCIEASGASTVEPTHIETDPQAESDGYRWKYLQTVTVTDAEKFLTISYMPIQTVQMPTTGVVNGAISGAAVVVLDEANEYIKVGMRVTGTGISTAPTVTVISGTSITMSAVQTIANDVVLTFGLLADTDVNFANQSAQIDSLDASTAAGIERIEVVTAGSSYETTPTIAITGDGTGTSGGVSLATATAVMVSNALSSVTVTNKGTNFSVADVVISGGGGTEATARAVITPPKGHGVDPIAELGGFYVGINTLLSGTETGDLTVGQDFRQVSLIKNPKKPASETTATASTLRSRESLRLDSGANLSGYQVDQLITGSVSGAKAYLVQIDTTNKVFFFYQNSKTGYGNFVTNDSISATLPNSTQNVVLDTTDADSFYGNTADDVANSTAYAPEVKKNSGELIFLENRDPINRSSSQIEDIKLIIEF
jgi:hypothetical protein